VAVFGRGKVASIVWLRTLYHFFCVFYARFLHTFSLPLLFLRSRFIQKLKKNMFESTSSREFRFVSMRNLT
jgi:hypothetical protein